jgi:lipopolysaccharide transport system ATP-binding protein
MTDSPVVEVKGVSKSYRIWESPASRLQWPLVETVTRLTVGKKHLEQRLEAKAAHYYRDFYALEDVSLRLFPGQSLGIMGRNGSGKSTLLQIIAGTLRPTRGTAETWGRIGALLELGSGFNPDFTGRENVFLNAALLGLNRKQTAGRLDQILDFADIGEFIDQPIKTYSSGMVVRLAFAVQTAIDPEVLIVDEALAVGDESFQRKCFRRLDKLKKAGTALLFVSHAAPQVVELCDHAILLVKGRVSCEGKPKLVVNEYHRQIYGASDSRAEIGKKDQVENSAYELSSPTKWETTVDNLTEPQDESYLGELDQQGAVHAYDSVGAEISSPWIETDLGRQVNHLTLGCTYCYNYFVTFSSTLSHVRFGASIKLPTGLELAGMASHRSNDRIPEVAAGTRCRVRFSFICRLLPGAYFLNAGVLCIDGEGKEFFAHRLVDACYFRVNFVPDLPVNATVDLLDSVDVDFSINPNGPVPKLK